MTNNINIEKCFEVKRVNVLTSKQVTLNGVDYEYSSYSFQKNEVTPSIDGVTFDPIHISERTAIGKNFTTSETKVTINLAEVRKVLTKMKEGKIYRIRGYYYYIYLGNDVFYQLGERTYYQDENTSFWRSHEILIHTLDEIIKRRFSESDPKVITEIDDSNLNWKDITRKIEYVPSKRFRETVWECPGHPTIGLKLIRRDQMEGVYIFGVFQKIDGEWVKTQFRKTTSNPMEFLNLEPEQFSDESKVVGLNGSFTEVTAFEVVTKNNKRKRGIIITDDGVEWRRFVNEPMYHLETSEIRSWKDINRIEL